MKKILLLALVVAIGIVCGVVLAFVQVQASTARVTLLPSELENGRSVDNADVLLPKAVVDSEVFDFGVMDKSGRSNHEFTVTNEGKAPLTLIKGHSTCKCTMAKLKRESILPGESTKINVEWTAREYLGPFEQIATIQTNDPQRPEIKLKIKGWTTTKLKFMPDELIFGQISAGREVASKVNLFVKVNDPVKILGVECAEPVSAEFFDVSYTPLSEGVLKTEINAKGGYSITVKLKPGLPQGAFQQTIRFRTSLSTVELPVKGVVGSDVSIIGSGWDKQKSMLTIGMVDGSKGDKRTLRLVVHGLYRKDIKFKVAETWPAEFLHAKLGKTTEINHGKATLTPLEIEIPKGLRPANHMASRQGTPGRIVLECNHPHVPKINILVQFAVEGG